MRVRTPLPFRQLVERAPNVGGIYEFIRDTLDPLVTAHLLKTDNYFYLLVWVLPSSELTPSDTAIKALLGHYTRESCPQYLTRFGFDALKANNGQVLDAFRLHTDSIVK
jgi:betaine lipid synthase